MEIILQEPGITQNRLGFQGQGFQCPSCGVCCVLVLESTGPDLGIEAWWYCEECLEPEKKLDLYKE
jgi:hypothetical protein